jgi:hypothetical protein
LDIQVRNIEVLVLYIMVATLVLSLYSCLNFILWDKELKNKTQKAKNIKAQRPNGISAFSFVQKKKYMNHVSTRTIIRWG